MFSAIPSVTTVSVTSPAAQSSAMEQVSQVIRTNNSEQLEARSVPAMQEDANSQQVRRKNEDDDRPKQQTREKTTFQYQESQQSTQTEQASHASINRSRLSLDIMA